jgi:RNA polymerase sigma-70 factor (ECF subfamily)
MSTATPIPSTSSAPTSDASTSSASTSSASTSGPATTPTTRPEVAFADLEAYRAELTGYCYRMLGSAFDAEDAVQDTLTKAWRAVDRFEGRSSLRTWLYRIATNVCLDLLNGRGRRTRPVDLGPSSTVAEAQLVARPDATWVEPVPDGRLLPTDADPSEIAATRESVRLAFVAALQLLPPRQRAVLVLREVLRWQASEVAELLDTTVASVNSALQRARATIQARQPDSGEAFDPLDERQRELLARYLDAFERYDMEALAALLHEDATQSMPPFDLWIEGRDEVLAWLAGPGAECEGSRLVPTVANGMPAFGQYRRAEDGDGHAAWALQVLEVRDGRIVGNVAFLDVARWFPLFGLPERL